MAHSSIYQISFEPLHKDEWITPDDFYQGYDAMFEYATDLDKDERRDALKHLTKILKGVCTRKGHTLTIVNMEKFWKRWNNAIRKQLDVVKENPLKNQEELRRVEYTYEMTHKGVGDLFYIDNWNNCADYFNSFCNMCRDKGEGTKLYIGGIVGFHW